MTKPNIIKSLLDNDFYKFSMQYAVIKLFPDYIVKYEFIDRNNIIFPDGFDIELKKQIELMKKLHLKKDERMFFEEMCGHYFPPFYFDFLENYRFEPNEVNVSLDDKNHLHLQIEGYWYKTILWEVPLLAIISELYYKMTGQIVEINKPDILDSDLLKCKKIVENNLIISEFGTRRRYSFENQEKIVMVFKAATGNNFLGTSNVFMAYKFDARPIGTVAHEWFMFHGAIYGYKSANKSALENWVKIYQGNLGIALSDTYTTDNFIQSFDSFYARLFDGVRQDSGDPFLFADKIINTYKKLNIEPLTKTIIFSDNLNIDLAIDIKNYCTGKINPLFGIGTNFTNDVGVKPLNIVIKISSILINNEWHNTIKISDEPNKSTKNYDEIEICKKTLKIK
jgi:nicotinate phosphoribosyltransferase